MVSVRVQHEPALVGVNGIEHVIRPLILKVQMRIWRRSSLGYKFQGETGRIIKTLWRLALPRMQQVPLLTLWIRGERGRTRTCDPCLKRALLYQLSYAPALSQYYCIKWKAVAPGPQFLPL